MTINVSYLFVPTNCQSLPPRCVITPSPAPVAPPPLKPLEMIGAITVNIEILRHSPTQELED